MATPHRYLSPIALYVCVDIPPQNLPLHTVNRTAILNTSLILDIWLKCTTVENSFTWPSFGNFRPYSHQSACLDLLLSPRFPHQTVLPFHTCSSVIHVQWKCAWVSCLTVPCRIVFAIISCWHIFIDTSNWLVEQTSVKAGESVELLTVEINSPFCRTLHFDALKWHIVTD